MIHPPDAQQAHITEIFSSLQGEGTHLGEPHIFIRFEECHMHCVYCDELDKIGRSMALEDVMEKVRGLEGQEGPHSYVSLTGGEPLFYLPFLKPLMTHLKQQNFKTYLETSGVLWKSLEEVIDLCDVVAMDMKPASVTHERNFFEEHRKFLKIALQKETFIKVVVSKEISIEEFDQLIKIIQETDKNIPLVLQPLSAAIEGHEDPALMDLMKSLQRRASNVLRHVLLVPRLHKILKIR